MNGVVEEDQDLLLAVMKAENGMIEVAEAEGIDDLDAAGFRQLADHLEAYAKELRGSADEMDAGGAVRQ